jgi:hypothetical protein
MLTSLPGRLGGEQRFDNGGCVALPLTMTSEIIQSVFVEKVEITNTNTAVSGLTCIVSVSDGNGMPLITPTALGPGEILSYTAAGGRRMTNGVKWMSDTAGCLGYISGFQ